MRFTVLSKDRESCARNGRVDVRGKSFRTPAFMPVGTAATVKGARPEDLKEAGVDVVLCNTYHLHLRPGEETVAGVGGLHSFMGWDGVILTDSGGFQIFSLADLVSVDDEGVSFKSHLDGNKVRLTPEDAVKIQEKLGSDITMVLDQCVEHPASRSNVAKAVERTSRWAKRSIETHKKKGSKTALFGIIQGGVLEELRRISAGAVTEMPFDGFAIGGLSVGEGKELMREVLGFTAPLLPEDKPRYLMGVGAPDDILDAVACGIDMFDCVMPTRNARNATLFTINGPLKLRNAALKNDPSPPDPACGCPLCRTYSSAYIRHLFNAGEMLGPVLATLHNLRFYQDMMRGIRDAVSKGGFMEFRKAFMEQYSRNETG